MRRLTPRVTETSSTQLAAPRTAPRASRRRLLADGLSTVAVLVGGARATSLSRDERSLLAGINAARVIRGLRPLRPSQPLSDTARAHDLEMVRFGYFGHTSHDGAPYWRRIERRYTPGRSRWAVGETLLGTSPSIGPAGVVAAWLGSAEHRAVLLDPSWRDVGVAVLHVPDAPGVFGNQPTTVVTADFGVRS